MGEHSSPVAVMRLQRDLFGVTLSLGLFGFANGVLGVFIPLVLLSAGAPLWQIPAFNAVYALVKSVINFPIAHYVVQSRGVHRAFAIGFIATAAQFASLQLFVWSGSKWWALASAVSLAVVNASMWSSQHVHISMVVKSAGRSSSLATIETINQALSVAAPFIGGVIGALFGPSWLIGFALAVLMTAFVPLRHIGKLHTQHSNGKADAPLRYSLNGAPRRDLFANFSINRETSVGIFFGRSFWQSRLRRMNRSA